jgi:hypothetical protein
MTIELLEEKRSDIKVELMREIKTVLDPVT